jgi:hypothetical protein
VTLFLEANVDIHAFNAPFPLAQQTPQPFNTQPRPLVSARDGLVERSPDQRARRRAGHVHNSRVKVGFVFAAAAAAAGGEGRRRPGLEPVAAKVEEASVGPVARGDEENEEQDGAVDAGPVEEPGADEEEEDEGGRGVGRDEEQGEPTAEAEHDAKRFYGTTPLPS